MTLYRAKIALFNQRGELLVLTRAKDDFIRPGGFDLPGGGIDEGESPTDAVLREVHEEIGLQLGAGDVELAYSDTHWYEDKSTLRFLYIAQLDTQPQVKLSHEHDIYEWMPLDEALRTYDHPVWIEGLKYLKKHQLISY